MSCYCWQVVVVSRWFGGVLLGPDRFKHINNAARSTLAAYGYIEGSRPSVSSTQKTSAKSNSQKGGCNIQTSINIVLFFHYTLFYCFVTAWILTLTLAFLTGKKR
jgi:hypothetical protein